MSEYKKMGAVALISLAVVVAYDSNFLNIRGMIRKILPGGAA